MIGKIVKGSGFKGYIAYVLGKDKAQLLDCFGVLSESERAIVKSFCTQSLLNPNVKKPVGHISLSFSAEDAPRLSDDKMVQLAREYMREMKIVDTQYLIVRHHDREHPHVHIVFNRIDNNGKVISDKNDRYRNERVCKRLKIEHGLYFATSKESVKQDRLREPDKTKYQIYSAVRMGLKQSKNWQELQAYLFKQDIQVHFKYKGQTKVVQGVSFAKRGYSFKGSEIDRAFSFSKLDTLLSESNSIRKIGYSCVQDEHMKPQVPKFVFGIGGVSVLGNSKLIADDFDDLYWYGLKKKKKRKIKR